MIQRIANPADADVLSELALRSKAHWGYSPEFMEVCQHELIITPQDCMSGLIVVAEENDAIMGFYQLAGTPPKGKLDDLFVDPAYMSKGLGSALFKGAIKHARRLGFTSLDIHSDPHAEAFYLHMGAQRVGDLPSGSIPGRTLPLLEVAIT
ncbi:MAG TPA: GNAT family N-acetyltransferase [Candidatus Saccharimonadia bacterium]|nr:GNAT family N-acetyltransferase [Candidatus Saccharimonadia bacterium]